MTSEVVKGRYYPQMPPALEGEDDDHYTNRLSGVYGDLQDPYDHVRYRQCSIGYHLECSQWRGDSRECKCPCHDDPKMARYYLVQRYEAWVTDCTCDRGYPSYGPGKKHLPSCQRGTEEEVREVLGIDFPPFD